MQPQNGDYITQVNFVDVDNNGAMGAQLGALTGTGSTTGNNIQAQDVPRMGFPRGAGDASIADALILAKMHTRTVMVHIVNFPNSQIGGVRL